MSRSNNTKDTQVDQLLHRLSAHLPDRILRPDDPDYDTARRVYFTGVDRRPAAVIRPRNTDEVADAVRIVSEEGGRLTVKGGGHGFSSLGVLDGIVALDLSLLNGILVDPEAGVARAGGGVTTGAYTRAAGEHGLATGFGDSPKVGIGGIAQSGGIGFLHRSLGLTADHLLSAEVVTAKGEVLEVDETRHPDLFWALRGGGGGFGAVARLDLRLGQVDRVTGGMLLASGDPGVLHGYLELLSAAPNTLSGLVQVLRARPLPLFPRELHGTMLLGAYLVHAGDPEEGRDWMDRFRALSPPVMDAIDFVPYPALFEEHDGPPDPPHLGVDRSSATPSSAPSSTPCSPPWSHLTPGSCAPSRLRARLGEGPGAFEPYSPARVQEANRELSVRRRQRYLSPRCPRVDGGRVRLRPSASAPATEALSGHPFSDPDKNDEAIQIDPLERRARAPPLCPAHSG